MQNNQELNDFGEINYTLLNNIEDEIIYIGPDKEIQWINKSASKLVNVSEDTHCYSTLCSRINECEDCILSGGKSFCEENFQTKPEKIVGHYSVGEEYNKGILLVFGNRIRESNHNTSEMEVIQNKKLFHEANHDPLTSLYNRRYMEYLFKLIDDDKRNSRSNEKIILSLIDIDRFKQINDEYGHHIGDEVLKIISYRISSEIRKSDTAIRIGGDEFLIIHTEHSDYNILSFLKRLVNHIKKPIHLDDGRVLNISISIGILLDAQKHKTLSMAMKCADHALYEAKEREPDRTNYIFFGKNLEKEITLSNQISESLDEALLQNDLSVHYQPIICLKTERICGVETLIRWLSDEGIKKYSPKEFLQVAESRNVIFNIGEHLLREVAGDIEKYHKCIKNLEFISINFSTRQFMSTQYIDFMKKIISNTKMDLKKLKVEINETSLLHDIKFTKKIVHDLNKIGIEIVLDDYGFGYSSLSYLLEYDIKKIKLDKRLIHGLQSDENSRKLVSTLVYIAKTYGITIIAKGVETKQQYDLVKKLGCDCAQGFYITQPLPIDKYAKFTRDYYMKINQLTLLPPE